MQSVEQQQGWIVRMFEDSRIAQDTIYIYNLVLELVRSGFIFGPSSLKESRLLRACYIREQVDIRLPRARPLPTRISQHQSLQQHPLSSSFILSWTQTLIMLIIYLFLAALFLFGPAPAPRGATNRPPRATEVERENEQRRLCRNMYKTYVCDRPTPLTIDACNTWGLCMHAQRAESTGGCKI